VETGELVVLLETLAATIDDLEPAPVAGDPARFATDAVPGALEATARLHPELGGRVRRLSAILREPEMSQIWVSGPQELDEPSPAEGFDIDRVLADL
jgi:hypothetical protein